MTMPISSSDPTTALTPSKPVSVVSITVGGLCMLVKCTGSRASRGLYVLMPALREPGMVHCPLLVTADRVAYPLRDSFSWDSLATKELDAVLPVASLLTISQYAKRPVAQAWLSEHAATSGPLAVQIRLPLGCVVSPGARTARLNVPGPQVGNFLDTVSIELSLKSARSLSIGTVNLHGDSQGLLRFSLLNVPWSQVRGQQYTHSHGDRVRHADAYYSLLNPPADPNAFPITVAEDVTGAGDPPPNDYCPAGPVEIGPVSFGDPYNCTVGHGCEELPCE